MMRLVQLHTNGHLGIKLSVLNNKDYSRVIAGVHKDTRLSVETRTRLFRSVEGLPHIDY